MSVSSTELVRSYVRHHLAAARGGVDLFERAADSAQGSTATELAALAAEVGEDREALVRIGAAVGASQPDAWQWVASVGERLGRLKPNGSWRRRTALTDLLEMEMLSIAVEGKRRGWLALLEVAPHDARLDGELLQALAARSEEQLDRLRVLHARAAESLATAPDPQG